MSIDREARMDSAVSTINLGAFSNHFPDVIQLTKEFNLELPKIVVVGRRSESAASRLIEALSGFSVCLKEINNPVTYRFIKDNTCGDNEAFCTVGETKVEIDLATEYETVIERLTEHNNWEPDSHDFDSIELEIRANCLANVEIVDLPFDPISLIEDWLDQYADPEESPRIVTIELGLGERDLELDSESFVRVSLDLSVGSTEDFISKIRSALLQSILEHSDINTARDKVFKKLSELDGHISATNNGKRRMLSNMFKVYTETLEDVLRFVLVCYDLFPDMMRSHPEKVCPLVNDPSQTIDGIMEAFRKICDGTAQDHFSRFPLIVSELMKISHALLEHIVRPRLKETLEILSQNPFLLAHEFVCINREHPDHNACGYVFLMGAFMGPGIDRMRHTLIAKVESQLFSWIPLLQEPEAITNERNQLRKKMKLMHNAYASIKYYDGNAISS